MQHTTNFNLNKPDRSDQYNIDHFNDNADKIDQLLAGMQNITNTTFKRVLLDLVYPVGSIYWSGRSTNPGTLFGGTWKQIKDTFVYAKGDYDTLNSTGGQRSVTLAERDIPRHSHTLAEHYHAFTPAGSISPASHNHSFKPSGTISGFDTHTHEQSPHRHYFKPTGYTDDAGAHTHERGTMEITGRYLAQTYSKPNVPSDNSKYSGAFEPDYSHTDYIDEGKSSSGEYPGFKFTASKGWTGATSSNGKHNHTFYGWTTATDEPVYFKEGDSKMTKAPSGTLTFSSNEQNTYAATLSFSGTNGLTKGGTKSKDGYTGASYDFTQTGYNYSNSVNQYGQEISAQNSVSIMPPYVVKYCWERIA